MKNCFRYCSLLLIVCFGCATTKVAEFTPDETAVRVIENLPANKDQLFIHSNRWMIDSFRSAKDVIQYTDKEAGLLVGKMTLYYEPGQYVGYGVTTSETLAQATVEINVRDNKVKIEIKPLGGWRYSVNNQGASATEPKKYVVENNVMKEVEIKESQEYFETYGFTKTTALKRINALADDFVKHINKPVSDF